MQAKVDVAPIASDYRVIRTLTKLGEVLCKLRNTRESGVPISRSS